jgi:hypothetical protein
MFRTSYSLLPFSSGSLTNLSEKAVHLILQSSRERKLGRRAELKFPPPKLTHYNSSIYMGLGLLDASNGEPSKWTETALKVDYAIAKIPDQQAMAEFVKISRCHCDFPRRTIPQTILQTLQPVPPSRRT